MFNCYLIIGRLLILGQVLRFIHDFIRSNQDSMKTENRLQMHFYTLEIHSCVIGKNSLCFQTSTAGRV